MEKGKKENFKERGEDPRILNKNPKTITNYLMIFL